MTKKCEVYYTEEHDELMPAQRRAPLLKAGGRAAADESGEPNERDLDFPLTLPPLPRPDMVG